MLTVRSGAFLVKPAAEYVFKAGAEQRTVSADAAGSLRLPLELGERAEISITASAARAKQPRNHGSR